MKILDLNCQKSYNPNLKDFLRRNIASGEYDFILLQEADAKVLPIIKDGAYQLLGAVNPDNGIQSHICMLYRNNFKLESSDFVSFSKMNKQFALRGEPGFLLGVFDVGTKKMVVASAHQHPGLWFKIRARELRMIKNKVSIYLNGNIPVIFGGDFNLCFPWECGHATKVFAPEFFDATAKIDATLNSLYTEPGNRIDSKIGNILAACGIGVKFKTDRIFIDENTAKQHKITTCILPDRVSDHSPVEISIL